MHELDVDIDDSKSRIRYRHL